MGKTISGSVTDTDGKAVVNATVALLQLPDSICVDAQLSDENGKFEFRGCPNSEYLLSIECWGYEKKLLNVSGDGSDVVMTPVESELAEFVVTAKRPVLSHEAGKFTFVPNGLAKDVTDGLNLLKYVPLLSVGDGGAQIMGKTGNSVIFINGRRPIMPQVDVLSMLKSLPPSYIKKVEIITEPGSKNRASETNGIVNVIIDYPDQGIVGRVSADVTYHNERVTPRGSLWLGYSKGRFNASGNLFLRDFNSKESVNIVYEYPTLNRTVTSDDEYTYSRLRAGLNFSATYDITSKSVVGVSFVLSDSRNKTGTYSNLNYVTEDGTWDSYSRFVSKAKFGLPNLDSGFVAYYNIKTDDRGSSFDISADYSFKNSQSDEDQFFNGEKKFQKLDIWSGCLHVSPSYRLVFGDRSRMDLGGDVYTSKTDKDYDYYEDSGRYVYKETVGAAYVSYFRQWSSIFSTKVGLRLETTHNNNESYGLSHDVSKNDYTDLFPSMSFSLDIPKGIQNISLNLSKSVLRPEYSRRSTFKSWDTENRYSVGSADIDPTYSYRAELYYSFLRNYALSLSYRHSSGIYATYSTYSDDGKTVSYTDNGSSGNFYDIQGSYYNVLFKNTWYVNAQVRATLANVNRFSSGRVFDYDTFSVLIMFTNNVVISRRHRLILELFSMVTSPDKNLTRNHPGWDNMTDISLKKQFSCGATISIGVGDICFGPKRENYTSDGYNFVSNIKKPGVSLSISGSYTFGHKSVSGAEDKSRTKLDSVY